MKKTYIYKIIMITFLIAPITVNAGRGCCSHHGGVAGCSESGRQICNDGTFSPSCTCQPTITYTYGCTDKEAKNYNSRANRDDGSCIYYKYGCTDETAKNFDNTAEKDDNSCQYYKYGCTDEKASNYQLEADKDDGSCIYPTEKVYNDNFETESNSILPIITLGSIGAGIYYFKKKKKK